VLCGLFPFAWRRGRAELWKHRSCYLSTPLLGRGSPSPPALLLRPSRAAHRPGPAGRVPGDGPFQNLHLVDELNRRGWPSLVSSWYTRALFRPAASGGRVPRARAERQAPQRSCAASGPRLAEQGRLELCELSPGRTPHRGSASSSRWRRAAGRHPGSPAPFHPPERAYVGRWPRAPPARPAHDDGAAPGRPPHRLKYTCSPGTARSPQDRLRRVFAGITRSCWRSTHPPAAPDAGGCADGFLRGANRFMINHLWPERRECRRVLLDGRALPSLFSGAGAAFQFARARPAPPEVR